MTMEYWLINLLGLVIAFELLVIITRLTGESITFAHLFSLVWAVALIASQYSLNGSLRPREMVLLFLYSAWWVFLIASILVLLGYDRTTTPKTRKIENTRAKFVLIILILLHVITVLLELNWLEGLWFGGSSSGLQALLGDNTLLLLATLRNSKEFGIIDTPWYLQIFRWGFIYYVPLAVLLFSQRQISKNQLILILSIAVILSFSRYTRAPFVQLIIFLFVSWIMVFRPKLTYQFFIGSISLITTIAVFLYMQWMISSEEKGLGFIGWNRQLAAYFGGPIKAYERLFSGEYPRLEGLYSLDMLNLPLFRLGLIESYPKLSRAYISNPITTNVYTYLDAFTLDFGALGALVGSFGLGLFAAWLYIRVKRDPSYSNIVVYAYATYACAMVPINNEFIRFGLLLAIVFAWILGKVIEDRQQSENAHVLKTTEQENAFDLSAEVRA